MNRSHKLTPRQRWVMTVFAAAVLLPSLYGFGTKFFEFVSLYRGDVDGAFAISPILNYLLASLGFLFLFAWAALGGMFRDIEGPKYTLLDNEALLDHPPVPLRANRSTASRGASPDVLSPAKPQNRVQRHYDHD